MSDFIKPESLAICCNEFSLQRLTRPGPYAFPIRPATTFCIHRAKAGVDIPPYTKTFGIRSWGLWSEKA
ncbi:hypothetical protein X474_18100 [Dethiosulfatarculus sandiegensis]|uniref:Uncharacterized protein n=1 Tax=Dethiosulfatarculus sandiegensis TaxID=1429043 RepID=A0A0D2JA26_9BACT|nr:hypothetical protein X474_18100 [Dethiosulfatarculus sandiegensis]